MDDNYFTNLVTIFKTTRNQVLKKMTERRLKVAKCMFCEFPVGGSFETFGNSVICCSCYYEIGSDEG
jgi:hypothetical protein